MRISRRMHQPITAHAAKRLIRDRIGIASFEDRCRSAQSDTSNRVDLRTQCIQCIQFW